jgi:uncharacterized membrane protein
MRTADQRGALPPVLAEPAVSSGGYRLRWAGITRVAFGKLLAVFAYSVTALVLSHGRSGPAASCAVDVAAVLVAASLVVFLRYVASMMELLQVVDVISAVARETKAAVAASWLPSPAGRPAAAPARSDSPALLRRPAAGLRQLADIAAQALSSAVNRPTTAVLVIDSLEDVLLQIARSPRQSGCYTDRDGTVRLVKPLPGWEDCLDLAFTEITVYGAASPQVARRLLAAYATLEAAAGPARRAGVAARREELARQLASDGTAQQALRADPMGLG